MTSTRGPSALEDRQGIPVHAIHSNYAERWVAWFGLLNPQTIVPLTRLFRKLRPDVVNAHNIHQHLSYHSLVLARRVRAATVFTAHDVMPFAYAKLTRFIDPNRPDQCDGWDYRLPFGYNIRQMRLRWNPARNLSIRHTMVYYMDARVAVSGALRDALQANRRRRSRIHSGIDLDSVDIRGERGCCASGIGWGAARDRVRRASQPQRDRQLFAALRKVKEPDVALLVLLARPITPSGCCATTPT